MMRNVIILLILYLGTALRLKSQTNLDSLFASLDNKDLYIAPIIYNPWGPTNQNLDKDSIRLHKRLFIVSSLDLDIRDLAKKYSQKTVVVKLYVLLQDPNKDLYANALLYDLLDNRKLGNILYMKREEWLAKGRNVSDKLYWDRMKTKIFTE